MSFSEFFLCYFNQSLSLFIEITHHTTIIAEESLNRLSEKHDAHRTGRVTHSLSHSTAVAVFAATSSQTAALRCHKIL